MFFVRLTGRLSQGQPDPDQRKKFMFMCLFLFLETVLSKQYSARFLEGGVANGRSWFKMMFRKSGPKWSEVA